MIFLIGSVTLFCLSLALCEGAWQLVQHIRQGRAIRRRLRTVGGRR